ncbi:GGDEF domain-containing protein [Solirubrobacter taibaiensis]|nr:GGDEF domain-containing protein [Solirubrobacter taibaiensis]
MKVTPERSMIRSGAAIYAAAAAVGAVETAIPGGPSFSDIPGVVGLILIPLVLVVGPRVPRAAMVALGPLGAALIAFTVATTVGYSDAAILYSWPALWVAYFFGPRETALTVVSIGVAHGAALLLMAAGEGNIDRWLDVMVSTTMIATVVQVLAARNRGLVTQLRAEARVDPLTGLLNRRGLAERLEIELARSRRDGTEIAVVAVDIDRFKSINDTFGHDVGDQVLTWIAQTIRGQTRVSDLTARLGGDEFLVALPTTDADAARDFAERLRVAIASGTRRLPAGLAVSISAGVAAGTAPPDAQVLTTLADRALYAAKERGRNVVHVDDAVDLSQRN